MRYVYVYVMHLCVVCCVLRVAFVACFPFLFFFRVILLGALFFLFFSISIYLDRTSGVTWEVWMDVHSNGE